MPKVTLPGAMSIHNHAINGAECNFISNFITSSDENGFTFNGMIFGEGDVILEYWAGVAMWMELRYSRFFLQDPIAIAEVKQRLSQPDVLYTHYAAFCKYYIDEGHVSMPARSNVYIAFGKYGDNLKIEGSYWVDRTRSGHQLTAQFGKRAPAERFDFFLRMQKSSFGLRQTSTSSVIRGVEKDVINSAGHIGQVGKFDAGNVTSIRQFMVRRACKFLLYDLLLEQHQTIHYALDHINPTYVVDKSAITIPDREINSPKVPVCTSELRELFRFWNLFSRYVKFYIDFKIVEPLWKTAIPVDKEKWATYAVRLLNKITARDIAVEKAKTDIAEHVRQRQFDEAIATYHSIDWRLLPNAQYKHEKAAAQF